MSRLALAFVLSIWAMDGLACSYCRTAGSGKPTPSTQAPQQSAGGMVVRGAAAPVKASLSESGEFFKSIGNAQDVEIIEDEITVVPSVYQGQ